MQQVLTACLAVVGLAFTGANAGFAADMAVPPLIAPVAALMAVLKRCRELCLAAAYALALTGVAGAADLPFKMPIVAPVPAFSWTGVYLGIGGGTGWGNKEYTWNQDPTVAAIGAQMGGAGPLPTAWRDPRIGPDQRRVFRRPTWRKLAGRVGRFRNPGRRSLG